MRILIFKTSMCMLLLAAGLNIAAQHNISQYKLGPVHDPFMPMITNRLIDTIHPKHLDLVNEVDLQHPMKVFLVENRTDSVYCRLSDEGMLKQLFAEAGNDWVLLIHGDSKAPVDAAVRGLQVQNMYHVKVLVFSWPSMADTRDGLKNFRNSQGNVEAGLGQFQELLFMLQKFRRSDTWPDENHLSLLMHSLGNYYLELAAKKSMLEVLDTALFDNIIINSAAIEQEGHAGWVEQINISRRIFIISNRKDFNLMGARFFTRAGKQLGGPVELPLAGNAIYINFTQAVGFKLPTWLSHTFFVGDIPQKSHNIREFYTTIFHGNEPDFKDENLFQLRDDGKGIDIIR